MKDNKSLPVLRGEPPYIPSIGAVIKAEIPEWSHWVMKLTVDFGAEIG